MRSRQALRNMMANILLQIIVFFAGIVFPRYFIEVYGSSINGLVTSITQFLTYLELAEAGVGTASIVALYKPLAENNIGEVNSVLSASRQYYNRSGSVFLSLSIGLAIIFPYVINQQLDSRLVRGMVLILVSSTLIDYFFLGKYKVLLTANQQGYVVVLAQAVGLILNVSVTVLLISQSVNVLIVKLVATIVYALRFFFIRYYVKKHFPEIDYHASPNFSALHQRSAALLHQVVGLIVNNTDVVILTVFFGSNSLLEVSVYSIYNMIIMALYSLLNSFANGLTSGFGELVSKKETEALKQSYSNFEYMYFTLFFIAFACIAILLSPFISVYTAGIKDVNYYRPTIAVLFVIVFFFQNIRLPGITLISAYGHFKETRGQAICEASINLIVSLALLKPFGMAGLLSGTIVSYGLRSCEIMYYNAKKLVPTTGKQTVIRVARSVAVSVILIVVGVHIVPQQMTSYLQWFGYAFVWGSVSTVCFCMLNFICEKDEFMMLIERLKQSICK